MRFSFLSTRVVLLNLSSDSGMCSCHADRLARFQSLLFWCYRDTPHFPAPPTFSRCLTLPPFFPQRTFLKKKNNKNISIQAIGLSLYEDLEIWKAANQGKDSEPEVIKTQWLNFDSSETSLIGRTILIVDEVDDTRRTLAYAVRELRKDLEKEAAKLVELGKEIPETKIGVFVLHNKLKDKREVLSDDIMDGRYFACKQMPDQWLVYPWDALDIEEHTTKALATTY